jgi:hypothetical protein
MDVSRARRIRVVGRSLVPIFPLLILLVVSVMWNVWQYRRIDHARQRMLITEREKAKEAASEAARIQARRAKEAENAAANERTQQLYREINNLSQMSERLLAQPTEQPASQSMTDSPETADGLP